MTFCAKPGAFYTFFGVSVPSEKEKKKEKKKKCNCSPVSYN